MTEKHDKTTPEGRLRFARQRAGFDTADAAAERLGMQPARYRHYETGERGYSRHAIILGKVFKVSATWLLDGKGDPDDFVDDITRDTINLMKDLDERDREELRELARLKAARATSAPKK